MTTATTAKIITLAGNPNPPSLVALYGGSLGERKTTISDLENDLYAAGLSVIDFNARRFLSENDLSQPLIQQIVTELKSNQDTTGATADLVNRINESAPATISTHLTSENRIELIHQFDSSLKKLAAISLQKKPLVIIVQGLERTPTGSFISISEFIANYLNIHKFMFVVSIGEEILQNELTSSNSQMSPDGFLEDVFSAIVTFDEIAVDVEPTPAPVQDNEDLFIPPVGLEVESGAEIARRKTTATPKAGGLPQSRIFKVRELSGKRVRIKKGTAPKKKVIKKRAKKSGAKPKLFKPVPKNESSKIETFMEPVMNGDLLTAKKFWSKANELSYSEFTEIVKKITEETNNPDSRIRATAVTALASLANGVSWEMPPEVMDRALILTGDGSKEVRDAAAEAIKEMSGAGVETVPQFKPSVAPEVSQVSNNNMKLDELDTDGMLGKDNKSIGSLAIGTGSGGVKMMGGADEVVGSTTTFEISKEGPSFPVKTEDTPPKFTAVDKKKPEFKIAKE